MQLTHATSKFKHQKFPIVLVCENMTNAANVGSLFRTADTFGIEKIIFCGSTIPAGRKMTKTSRSTEKYVDFECCENAEKALEKLRLSAYEIVALKIASNSVPLYETKFHCQKPFAVVVGDENLGVSERCLKLCDHIVHIDMFGRNSSMNVVQATNIMLYEITKQLRQ